MATLERVKVVKGGADGDTNEVVVSIDCNSCVYRGECMGRGAEAGRFALKGCPAAYTVARRTAREIDKGGGARGNTDIKVRDDRTQGLGKTAAEVTIRVYQRQYQ